MAKKQHGTCKLTGDVGPFVKSHIIPDVYTRPSIRGGHLVQGGGGERPIKRWSSWYDASIVTRAGEDVLSDIDNRAHQELLRNRLTWSSWGPMLSLTTPDHIIINKETGAGIRYITGLDSRALRLFALSLLWRSAVTRLKEFEEVCLGEPAIKSLRQALVTGDPGPPSFFPVNFVQMSTRGIVHNFAPIVGTKLIPTMEDGVPNFKKPSSTIKMARFYLDGLIVHINLGEEDVEDKPLVLGSADNFVVVTVTFEDSWQLKNMREVMRDGYREWPDDMQKHSGPSFLYGL